MTPMSDCALIQGRYVSKKESAVPLSVSRKIERLYYEECGKNRILSGEIERAHRELDALGAPKNQRHTPQFQLSLLGRIRGIRIAMATHIENLDRLNANG